MSGFAIKNAITYGGIPVSNETANAISIENIPVDSNTEALQNGDVLTYIDGKWTYVNIGNSATGPTGQV